jgi:hypothetical protein
MVSTCTACEILHALLNLRGRHAQSALSGIADIIEELDQIKSGFDVAGEAQV